MPKVYGIFEFELKPGVDPEEVEKWAREEWMTLPWWDGVTPSLLKGIKGRREG